MFSHETHIRVRYAETDQMGVVYYGNYPQYYEVGRVELIRSIGITYKSIEERGILMPVTTMHIKYILPARYDELLRIETCITELPERRIHFRSEIFNEEGFLINSGTVSLAFVDSITKKAVIVPDFILNPLKPYYESKESTD